MTKRPLCAAALIWAVLLWLLGKAGIPYFSYSPPRLPFQESKSYTAVIGEVYKKEVYSLSTNLYLKHTNLITESKKYPIDNVKVTVSKEKLKDNVENGSRILAEGVLQEIPLPSNPGQFHERAYYYARKIKWYQKASAVFTVRKQPSSWIALQEAVKNYMRRGLYAAVPEKHAGLLAAMLLGEKSQAGERNRLLFELMGCSHILAISGLHLSVLGGGLFRGLRKLRAPVWAAGMISVAAMFFYGSITGNGAAVLRAAVMFAVSVGALLVKRTYDFLSAAALAAVLLLAESPLYLYDSSFLLSFGAILGLGLVLPVFFSTEKSRERKPISRKQRLKRKLLKSMLEGIKSGIAVWLVLLPVVMYFFYEVPVWGIFTNLLVLPTAGILLIFGALGGFLGCLPVAVFGKAAGALAVLILEVYLKTGELIEKIPGAMWITGRPQLWKCAVYYGILVMVLLGKKKNRNGNTNVSTGTNVKISTNISTNVSTNRNGSLNRSGAGRKSIDRKLNLLAAAAVFFLLVRLPYHGLEITFLDVGQGDCACIRADNDSCYIIDGGSSSVSGVGKYRILPFLESSGIRTVKGIFVSHMDEDHINGIEELLEAVQKKETRVQVKNLYWSACEETEEKSQSLVQAAEAAGCRVTELEKGMKLKDKQLEIQCLSPASEAWESNEASQVLKVSQGNFTALFTGDTEGRGEESLVKELKNRESPVSVLKVAHHGSKNSTGKELLELLYPEISVISCGAENSYGHPHKELLDRLEVYSKRCYITAERGAVTLRLKNRRLGISTELCP